MSFRIQSGAALSAAILGFVASSALLVSTTAWGQGIPGPSVNIIGPTPDLPHMLPDRGLKQQNEVNCTVRPDNALIAFCGYNDYRTTEIAESNDAWIGVSMTRDGGLTWTSRLAPGWANGYGPLGLDFAADPIVEAVPGLALVNFIAANRSGKGEGGLFLQRWVESDKENGFPYRPEQNTILITKGTSCPQCSGRFIDKPHMITHLDESGGTVPVSASLEPDLVTGTATTKTVQVPKGELHVVYSVFTGKKQGSSQILHTRSLDYGQTWEGNSKLSESVNINQSAFLVANGEEVFVVWRRFSDNNEENSLMYSLSGDRGQTWAPPEVLHNLSCPYDQPTANNMFRTTVHPVAATDGTNYYVFWSERGYDGVLRDGTATGEYNECTFGISRVVMKTLTPGSDWPNAPVVAVDADTEADVGFPGNNFGKGHQFMPSVAAANGVLQLAWFDSRDTIYQLHNEGVMDNFWTLTSPYIGKHSVDVRGTQIRGGVTQGRSVRVSTYPIIQVGDYSVQLAANLVNARMFAGGKVPFMGDYISVAGRRSRLEDDRWVNNQRSGGAEPPTFLTAWTDNRDSRGDRWGDLTDTPTTYQPSATNIPPKATLDAVEGSEANPAYRSDVCTFGESETDRTRDQNVYATTIKPGAAITLPTLSKRTGALQRGFVVNVENTNRKGDKYFALCIEDQPTDYNEDGTGNGLASFLQYPAPIAGGGSGPYTPAETLKIVVPPQSNSAQSVYVTSRAEAFPHIPVSAYEISKAAFEAPYFGGEGAFTCDNLSGATPVSTVVINGNRLAQDVSQPNTDPTGENCSEPDATTGARTCTPVQQTSESIAISEVHDPKILNYIWALYHKDALNLLLAEGENYLAINREFTEAIKINPLIMTRDAGDPTNPLIMTRDVSNPLIMTRDVSNPLIMTRDSTSNPLIMTRGDETNPLVMTRDGSTNPLVMTRDGTANPLVMTRSGDIDNPLIMTRDGEGNPLIMTRDDADNPLIMTIDDSKSPLIMTRDAEGNPLIMTRGDPDNPLIMTADGRIAVPAGVFPVDGSGNYNFPEGYVEVTWLVENDGNTVTAYNALPRVVGDALTVDGKVIPTQLIVSKPYLTYVSRNCVPGMQVQNQVILNSVNPFFKNGDTWEVDRGKATFFSSPGEEVTITLRVFDPSFNPRRLGFGVYSQSCDSGQDPETGTRDLNCSIEPYAEIEVDTTPPTTPTPFGISPTNNVTATGPGGATVTWSATSSEDAVDVTCSSAAGEYEGVNGAFSGLFAIGTTEVTCSATDSADNTSSASFEVIVEDVTPPVLVVPEEEVVAEAGSGGVAPVSFTTSANDYDGTVILGSDAIVCSAENSSGTIINPVVSGTEFGLGAWTVTCVATDGVGLTTTKTFTVTVADTTPPVLVKPDDISGVEATSSAGAPVTFGLPSASDLVGVTELYCVPASDSTFSLVDPDIPEPSTVICTAKDAAGNTATTSFGVTVVDTTAPVFDPVLADLTGSSTGLTDLLSFTPVARDYARDSDINVVDTAVDIACSYGAVGGDVSGYTALTAAGGTYSHDFPVGDTAVNCSATDDHGNSFADSFLVTVSDIGLPVVTAPLGITEEATGPDGTMVYFSADALDAISGTLSATCSITVDGVSELLVVDDDGASATYGQFNDEFPLGTTAVTCSATDLAGNIGEASFDVTVQDTTAPVLTVTGNPTAPVEATGFDGAPVTFNVDVLEVVTTGLSASCTDELDRAVESGVTAFAIGPHTVDCSATDEAGLEGTATFIFEVVDTTLPVLNLVAPADLTPEATSSDGSQLSFSVKASDVAWADVGLSCESIPSTELTIGDGGSVSAQFALGTTTVTCTATDGAGLSTPGSFTVTVRDTTDPELTVTPPATIHEADSASGKLVDYSVVATDTVGDVTLVCKSGSGGDLPFGSSVSYQFPLGTTTVTCTATDGSADTDPVTGGFSVTVVDTTAPLLTLVKPSEDPIAADSQDGASVSYSVSAVDVDDVSDVTLTCTNGSGDVLSTGDGTFELLFAMGETRVTCTATDAADPINNKTSDSFTVKVHFDTFIGMDIPNGMSIVDGNPDTRLDKGETALGNFSRTIPLYWQYGDLSGYPMDSGSADPVARIEQYGKKVDLTCDFKNKSIDAEDSGNSSMRYSSSSLAWKFNWKPSAGAGCYSITINSGLTGQSDGPYLFELR